MRLIINYLRSCFCKHEWELLKKSNIYDEDEDLPIGSKWIYRCKKCGYAKKYKDY